MNYTAQDILGVLLAFNLFPLLLIFPGYVMGFAFDLFHFKARRPIVQVGIASLVSASVSPVLFFLAYRLVSGTFALILAMAFAFIFILTLFRTRGFMAFMEDIKKDKFGRLGVYISAFWIIVAMFFLIDLQFGNRLYYNIIAYDYSTRVSIINAITRTGVPPVNPSYYPGSPQLVTQVYYFWYILCSMIDQIGGRFVNAHDALIASVIWTGLILASAVALLTRFRSVNKDKQTIWQNAYLGISLLLVSGLDIFPASLFALIPKFLLGRYFEGDIEQWNEQITAWMGAITWTPHHVIGLLACVLAWMLIASNWNKNGSRQIGICLISGLALASAFGLSLWIVLIFLIFWGIWFVTRLIQGESLKKLWIMILPGAFMLIALLPFLLDLFGGVQNGVTGGGFPLALTVRSFYPLEYVAVTVPAIERMLIYLLALPLNYFLELGFYLMVVIIWLRNCRDEQSSSNPLAATEMMLFLTTIILVTFMRSTVIVNNDFGWRGWMFGQFILLFWGVDVIQLVRNKNVASKIKMFQSAWPTKRVRKLLSTLVICGVLTTTLDVVLLRMWPMLIDTGIAGFPRVLSPDNHLGERTLAMRDAFAFIEANTSESSIVQFDPRHTIDRPAGLYRTRGTAISYHSLYGVPEEVFDPLITSIGSIFDDQNPNWQSLDNACRQYHINILILRDIDPIWSGLDQLKATRAPIYENRFTALFECGDNP